MLIRLFALCFRREIQVRATDPDDDSADPDPMKIKFTLSGSNAAYFSISAGGELRIVRKLDRDKPAGRKDWSVFVVAQDQLDGVVLESTLEVRALSLFLSQSPSRFRDLPRRPSSCDECCRCRCDALVLELL